MRPAECNTSIEDIARWCCRGGWPANLELDDEFALEIPGEYIASVLDISVPKMKKNPETARALMRALAVNISQAPKYATLAADMAYGDERREPDTQTVKSYLEMFKDLYLLTDLEGLGTATPRKRSRANQAQAIFQWILRCLLRF